MESTFSQDVKKELSEKIPSDFEGQLSELAGLMDTCADIDPESLRIRIQSDQQCVVEKCAVLLHRLFQLEVSCLPRNNRTWELKLENPEVTQTILEELGMLGPEGVVHEVPFFLLETQPLIQCYLRGAFLGCGFIADPYKRYHLELVDPDPDYLSSLAELMTAFELEVRMSERKRSGSSLYALYLKNGEQIVDFLNVCQAFTALMNLENVRIEKEIRNQINRSVNCETANLNKTVQAGLKQTEDIRFLVETVGWDGLTSGLSEMARIRLEHPEESLNELGRFFEPPIGRSGVNHRLRRLTEMAEQLRAKAGMQDSDSPENSEGEKE